MGLTDQELALLIYRLSKTIDLNDSEMMDIYSKIAAEAHSRETYRRDYD